MSFMAERRRDIERYFRSENTFLAHGLRKVFPQKGSEYLRSSLKRTADIALSLPLVVAGIPIVAGFAIARKVEDGENPFYSQERVDGSGNVFAIKKLKAMRRNNSSSAENIVYAATIKAEDDPRNTKVGRIMQKYDLNELPQLYHIMAGKMSLVGIRVAPRYIFEHLQKIRPLTYREWERSYFEGKPGAMGLNAVFNKNPKKDSKRHHYDMLYARKASLGLDLLIFYKTMVNFFKKFADS